MGNNEHVGKHAKLGDHWEPVETEFDESYRPQHGNSWQEMADTAPEFVYDSDRQKQIAEKWEQRFIAAKPGIAYNEKTYDELVDELLYNRDAIKYEHVSDEDKAMLDERKKNAEGMLKILERGALNYREDEPDASVELTDGSVILKEDCEACDAYRQASAATQPVYDEFYSNCPQPAEDLAYDEWTLITEGEVRGTYKWAPEPYTGIWDQWTEFRKGCLNNFTEETLSELQTFLFVDKDRHTHLEDRAWLVTFYNALNEYLHGEKDNPHNEEEA